MEQHRSSVKHEAELSINARFDLGSKLKLQYQGSAASEAAPSTNTKLKQVLVLEAQMHSIK